MENVNSSNKEVLSKGIKNKKKKLNLNIDNQYFKNQNKIKCNKSPRKVVVSLWAETGKWEM